MLCIDYKNKNNTKADSPAKAQLFPEIYLDRFLLDISSLNIPNFVFINIHELFFDKSGESWKTELTS